MRKARRNRQKQERLRCPCGRLMNHTRAAHTKCSQCRREAEREAAAVRRAARAARAPIPMAPCRDCGKQMHSKATNPICNACRKQRLLASLKVSHLQTHCLHGHEYTEQNIHIDSKGARRCKMCISLYQRKYAARGSRPKIRGHRTWRILRDEYRSECAAAKLPCWICSELIDYSLQWPDTMAFEADHVMGVKSHPELALERSNLAPAHAKCNRSRGATQVHADADQREAFLVGELDSAQREIARLRQMLSAPTQLQLIG